MAFLFAERWSALVFTKTLVYVILEVLFHLPPHWPIVYLGAFYYSPTMHPLWEKLSLNLLPSFLSKSKQKEDESAFEHTQRDLWSHFTLLLHASMAPEFFLPSMLTRAEIHARSRLPCSASLTLGVFPSCLNDHGTADFLPDFFVLGRHCCGFQWDKHCNNTIDYFLSSLWPH